MTGTWKSDGQYDFGSYYRLTYRERISLVNELRRTGWISLKDDRERTSYALGRRLLTVERMNS